MNIKKIKDKLKRLIRGGVTPEDLRKKGAIIGENVQIWTDKIDKGHAYLLTIGNNVTISDARILLHDASTKIPLGYSKIGRVQIGDNVFIGADAVVLPGISIGNNVIIGAGTIVNRSIPSNSVVVGNPAHIIGNYADFVLKNKRLMETSPVYDLYWWEMTADQKIAVKESLGDSIGFDL